MKTIDNIKNAHGQIDAELLEQIIYYAEEAEYVAEDSKGDDGDDITLMLKDLRDNALQFSGTSAAPYIRSLHLMARHYVAIIRNINQYTSALEQLTELKNEAMKLPLAANNEE